METIHTADEVRVGWDGGEPIKDGAVVVGRGRVAAVGTFAEIRERFPDARVRRWPGVLGPALIHEGPLPDAPTPRERVHSVLKAGAVAVLEEYADTVELRAAAGRNDVVVLSRVRPAGIVAGGRADLAVFDEDGACVATVCAGRLVHRRR
ncbi:imidazolonepropionase-like domain-containing protein [Streptomyces sp. NPDC050988]|uniref:imidazolonepropionase-like domain-containing protein n=1 Tax=Streptomyces sp. NPDC050988 TaxID=3365637 RepID=UPI003794854D